MRFFCRFPTSIPALILILLLAAVVTAGPAWAKDGPAQALERGVAQALERGVACLRAAEAREGYAPWTAVALRAAGFEAAPAPEAYLESLAPDGPTTDYALALLALLAGGGDPAGPAAARLVDGLTGAQRPDGKFADRPDGSGGELVNAHIWAVIALRAAGKEVPAAAKAREWLAAQQHPDGGFAWAAGLPAPDADMTAMALLAFAALGRGKEDLAVARALGYLRATQSRATGGFGGWGVETTADSCAVVILALTALGENPAGPAWSTTGGNPLTALLALQGRDGAFTYAAGQEKNLLSTRQAVLALADHQAGRPFWERLAAGKAAAENIAPPAREPGRGQTGAAAAGSRYASILPALLHAASLPALLHAASGLPGTGPFALQAAIIIGASFAEEVRAR